MQAVEMLVETVRTGGCGLSGGADIPLQAKCALQAIVKPLELDPESFPDQMHPGDPFHARYVWQRIVERSFQVCLVKCAPLNY